MGEFWNKVETRAKEIFAALCQWSVLAYLAAVVGSHVFFWTTVMFLDAKTAEWQSERHPLDPMDVQMCVATADDGACHRLVEQIEIAEHRAEHHFWIMRFYQIHHFGLLATAYWAGTLAAALLFLIAKKGWDDIDDRVQGLFLGLSTAAAFFGGFPGLIAAGQNVENNKKAYLEYDNLCVEIRSFLVAGDRPEVTPEAFVHEVDERLQEFNGIYFDLDESKVNAGKVRLLESIKETE